MRMLTRSIGYLRGQKPLLAIALVPFPDAACLPRSPMVAIFVLRFVTGDQPNAARTRGHL